MRIRLVIGSLIVLTTVTLSPGETPWGATTDQGRPTYAGGTAGSPDFDLSWHSIDGGGIMLSTGGDFELSGTIGQPDAGRLSSADGLFELTGGFWFEVLHSDCNADGVVNLFDYDTFHACLIGPGGGSLPPGCNCNDFDGDSVVTLLDFATMQRVFNEQ